MAPGSPGTELDPWRAVQPGDLEIIKPRYSAFFATSLNVTLAERGITTVIVLGLTTNVCVQSTARDAWQRDYHTITLADCCAEVGHGAHEASFTWTARNFGEVYQAEDVVTRWQSASGPTATSDRLFAHRRRSG